MCSAIFGVSEGVLASGFKAALTEYCKSSLTALRARVKWLFLQANLHRRPKWTYWQVCMQESFLAQLSINLILRGGDNNGENAFDFEIFNLLFCAFFCNFDSFSISLQLDNAICKMMMSALILYYASDTMGYYYDRT